MLKGIAVNGHEHDKGQRNVRWQEIDWKTATRIVRQLQSRIVKAEKAGNSAAARRLRSLLLRRDIDGIQRVAHNMGGPFFAILVGPCVIDLVKASVG